MLALLAPVGRGFYFAQVVSELSEGVGLRVS
jgi:hypothetical protein